MVQIRNGAPALNLFFILSCFHAIQVATIAAAATTNITATTTTTTDRTPAGFSLKLIHRDSFENITDDERLKRRLEHSRARAQWLESSLDITDLRPPMEIWKSYMVSVKIGTGEGAQDYFLELDTGSALTWTQCDPCEPQFRQDGRLFDPRSSPTYRQVRCDDPLCKYPRYSCVSNKCVYHMHYEDKSTSSGTLARETFSFQSTGGLGGYQSVAELAFGCSHEAHMKHVNGKSAGILGMNGSPESFAMQLAGISGGRFSYCLVPKGFEGHGGYLRFGSDIVMRGRVQQTPLVISRSGHYHLKLLDVSVGDRRLKLDRRVFALHADNSGGVSIDTGAEMTYLIFPAFFEALQALLEHMEKNNLTPVEKPKLGTCFPLQEGVQRILPSMTFHFEEADLEVAGTQMFITYDEEKVLCWSVLPEKSITTIGDSQLVNTRFLFDLKQKTLSFAPENCAEDAGM